MKDARRLADAFLDSLIHEQRYSEHTLRAYSTDLATYLDWVERGGYAPLAMTHRDFRRYLGDQDRASYARRTINRRLSAIRSFYAWLAEEGIVDSDTTALIRSPKIPKGLPLTVSRDEMHALLTETDISTPEGLRDRAIFELMYATGARISEISGLTLASFDPGEKTVRLFGKGQKERIVPLHDEAVRMVTEYLRVVRPTLMRPASGDALFLSSRGNPLSADAIRKRFKKALAEVGADSNLTPHALRHTFASDLLEGGADMRSVQELLGHESLSTTQVYTHVSIEHLKDTFNRAHPRD